MEVYISYYTPEKFSPAVKGLKSLCVQVERERDRQRDTKRERELL